MTKSMFVFSVPHGLQGPEFQGYRKDRAYELALEDWLHDGKADFVFEEAGSKPKSSIAQGLADSMLGKGHYLNVDPPLVERPSYGIAERDARGKLLLPSEVTNVEEQEERETAWLRRILETDFKEGLLICGYCHNLSIAFRLRSLGIHILGVQSYFPIAVKNLSC